MIGFVLFIGALLMLCFELANLYMQTMTQREVIERIPKQQKIAVTSKEYYRHFDLAATDLKANTGRRTKRSDK